MKTLNLNEWLKVGALVVSVLFVFVLYLHAENGKYQVAGCKVPMGKTVSPTTDLDKPIESETLETVVRINTRTGAVEYYQDLSVVAYDRAGKIRTGKVFLAWTGLSEGREKEIGYDNPKANKEDR